MTVAEFDGQGMIVLSGTAPWGTSIRLAEHELARALTRHAPVLFVDPPLSPVGALREPALRQQILGPRLRRLAPRLACLTPVVLPGKERPGVNRLTDALTGSAIRRAVRRLGGWVDVHLLTSPQRRLLGACHARITAYWAKDDHRLGAGLYGLPQQRIAAVEDALVRAADVVFVVSPRLRSRFEALGREPVLLPNGCDPAFLRTVDENASAADVIVPRPVVGYLGTLSDRIDAALLEAVAARGHGLLLVGDRRHLSADGWLRRLLARPNVQHVPGRPFAELLPYLAAIDVGIVPYREDGYNAASFPLKILEYLGAGIPVVSSDLPAAHWLSTPHVTIASGGAAFVNAVEDASNTAHDPAARQARRAVAAQHSWEARSDHVAASLGLPSVVAGTA